MGDLDMKAVRNAMTSRVDDLTTTKTMTMTTTPSPPPVASSTSQRTGKSAPRCRIMFTREQLAQLEKYFDRDRYPKIRERRRIAEAMAITERRVQVWFQNRRAKSIRSAPFRPAGDPRYLIDPLPPPLPPPPPPPPPPPRRRPPAPPIARSRVATGPRPRLARQTRENDSDGGGGSEESQSPLSATSYHSNRYSPAYATPRGVSYYAPCIPSPLYNDRRYSPYETTAPTPPTPVNGIMHRLDAVELDVVRKLSDVADAYAKRLNEMRQCCETLVFDF